MDSWPGVGVGTQAVGDEVGELWGKAGQVEETKVVLTQRLPCWAAGGEVDVEGGLEDNQAEAER